jgi:arsenate reductase-like glutaredoxin family protein
MKKAFDALNEKGLSYEFHDYKNKALMPKHLRSGWKKLGQTPS